MNNYLLYFIDFQYIKTNSTLSFKFANVQIINHAENQDVLKVMNSYQHSMC